MNADRKRVTEAFKQLRKRGFYAKQHATCCQTCAVDELPPASDKQQYYVFYHQQDDESVKETGRLYLSYGALDDADDGEAAPTGYLVFNALRDAGLTATWDGDVSQRIEVTINPDTTGKYDMDVCAD